MPSISEMIYVSQMVSSASAQIETSQSLRFLMNRSFEPAPRAAGGDHLKTFIIKNGKQVQVPDYATVRFFVVFFVH
jgi:hypothetical protein